MVTPQYWTNSEHSSLHAAWLKKSSMSGETIGLTCWCQKKYVVLFVLWRRGSDFVHMERKDWQMTPCPPIDLRLSSGLHCFPTAGEARKDQTENSASVKLFGPEQRPSPMELHAGF